jgi:hypothetical protein
MFATDRKKSQHHLPDCRLDGQLEVGFGYAAYALPRSQQADAGAPPVHRELV